jgi:hypothetical protein
MANSLHSDYCNCTCPEGLSYDKLEKTLNRVRMVHIMHERDGIQFCLACVDHEFFGEFQMYPCDTMKALAGEDNDA